MSNEKLIIDFVKSLNFESSYQCPSAWIGHEKLANFLIKTCKPKTIVELGVHNGFSYFSFCQTVHDYKLETKCFGIDNWKGDFHQGFYDEKIYEEALEQNKKYHYFSELIRKDFNSASTNFKDHSIDFLHIDGYHTYDAVKNDFANWLPKCTKDALILFHDVNEFKDDFGVYKFFNELKESYSHFTSPHAHGLGIITLSNNKNSIIHFLNTFDIQTNFSALLLGQHRELLKKKELDKNVKQQAKTITTKDEEIHHISSSLTQRMEETEQQAKTIETLKQNIITYSNYFKEIRLEYENSRSWKITYPLRYLSSKFKKIKQKIVYEKYKFKLLNNKIIKYEKENNFTNLKTDKKKFINKIIKIPSIKKNKLIDNIAIYLPQFHNDPYNNSFWGENFTEWTNLKKSKKLFRTHYLSSPLNGFYDITNKDIQALQSDLLDIYNLDAFCIYFYWFEKKRPLEKGILSYRDNNHANKKFFLCWANENWTRKWNGADHDVLLKQNYSEEDFIEMVEYLCKNYFSNKKYYKIGNKVVFMIYRPNLIPDLYKKIVLMREICKKNYNLELYLGYFESFERINPLEYNLDFSSDFSPNMKVKQSECKDLTSSINFFNTKSDTVLDYNSLVDVSKNYEFDNQYKKFRSVTPAWDNSPRVAGNSRIFINSDPEKFYYYTLNAIKYLKENFKEKKSFLFVNAFNEWGEGAYLEPDCDEGYSRLEAFRLATIGAAFIPYETNNINIKYKNSIFEDNDILSATINGNKKYDKNKKTILIVSHYINPNSTGAELSFLDIIKNIDQNKFNIILLLPSLGNKKYVLECINYGILIYVISSSPIIKNFYDIDILKKIKKIITFHKVNCIYLNTIVHNEILEIAKLNDITTIVHSREILSKDQHLQNCILGDSKISIDKFYEKFNHKNIHFIVNSVATKNELKNINNKKYLLYNSVETIDNKNYELLSSIREKSKIFNICIISTNDPRKGLENFFEVARKFESSDKIQFHIFGDTTQHLNDLFYKFKKPKNIYLRGYVPNPCKTIKDLHLLLSVSEFHESFGRTIVEAFSVGIPVIGNNKGALPELITSNVNGFNCLSIEDICKKILFLNNTNNYKEFSKNAYKSSLRFDEKIFKIKLNQIISKLI